jgi:putative DNA primase/helicase
VLLADLVKATGEPDPHAVEAARAVGGLLAVPDFGGNRPDGATDFNDMAMLCGLEAVKACIETAQPVGEPEAVPENVDFTIASLARMSDVEYEHARTGAAKRMGMRTSVLDKLVQSERKEKASDGIGFDDVEPWPEPVNGAALLSGIADTIRRFIVCNNEMADAAALWVAMTWFIDAIQIAPLAVITAPEKRCGKSQLLAILGKLSFRPMVASNITPAALFRVIDAYRPALMIDEADAFMKENEELRGLLRNI